VPRLPRHADTLTSRNNLAGVYQAAEDQGRAIPLYEVTLVDSERIHGPDHPSHTCQPAPRSAVAAVSRQAHSA
jgi:hypothetical protein